MDNSQLKQYLILRLDNKQYALDINCALEIVDPNQSGIIDSEKQLMPDKFPFGDNQIPLIDTARLVQGTEHESLMDTIVVMTEKGDDKAALIVDSADEILRVESDDIKDVKIEPGNPLSELLNRHIKTDDLKIPILNLERIYKLSGVLS